MSLSLNPFENVFETQTSPHALTLRSSVLIKRDQMLTVLFGNVSYNTTQKEFQGHLGILDFCTVGILLMLRLGFEWCMKHKNPVIKYGLGFLCGLLLYPLILATGLAFGILGYIIMRIVHVIANYGANGATLKAHALALNGNIVQTTLLTGQSSKEGQLVKILSLNSALLPGPDVSLEKIMYEEPLDRLVVTSARVDNHQLTLQMQKKGDTVTSFSFSSVLTDIDASQQQSLKALVILNAGGITAQLENTDDGKAALQTIMNW